AQIARGGEAQQPSDGLFTALLGPIAHQYLHGDLPARHLFFHPFEALPRRGGIRRPLDIEDAASSWKEPADLPPLNAANAVLAGGDNGDGEFRIFGAK